MTPLVRISRTGSNLELERILDVEQIGILTDTGVVDQVALKEVLPPEQHLLVTIDVPDHGHVDLLPDFRPA